MHCHAQVGIPDDPHVYNDFLQDWFCSKAGREHIEFLSSWPVVSAATSVPWSPMKPIALDRSKVVHRVLEATALLSIVFDMIWNDDYVLQLSSACYAYAQLSKCDRYYVTTVAPT